MANEQNLRPSEYKLSREEAKKGGIASGESRRNKKLLRDCIEVLLETEMDDGKGGKKTGAEALSVKLFKEALKGNVKAFEVLRDTAGQKPVEKIEQINVDAEYSASVEYVNDLMKNDE